MRLPIAREARLALALALACCTATVAAAPITYTFSGTASGTLDGNPFTDASFTATASGESTAVIEDSPGTFCNNLGTVTITIGGVGTVTTTGADLVFSNTTNEVWGFENGTCASFSEDWLDVTDPTSATYHLATPVGPSTGTQDGGSTVATSGGDLTLTSVPTTFTATGGGVGPVTGAVDVPATTTPALAVLALLLAAAVAPALRRRC
jgi:hypothetical protein